MILIGRYLSPYTRRVAVSLKVLDLPFERKPLTAWHNLDEVRQFNPVGRIPAMILDGGEMIFESSAILDEIDRMVEPGRALLPADGPKRRADLRTLAVATGIMDKAAAARYELVMRPEEKIHQPWVDHNLGQVLSGLEWLDALFVNVPRNMNISQAVITSVVAYDFLDFAMADLLDLEKYAALRDLSLKFRNQTPFLETRPEIDL